MPKSNFELEIIKRTVEIRENKYTQRDIATYLKVSAGYIGQVESKNSSSMYTYNQLNELAKLLKCSPQDFFPKNPI
ncbi:helix-turn-helix domain-containing protein [Sphingobacterium mizutaii]|uniref:helix-turn-helix domain-containing protein n=1 Tax=Sphingobacterium mizutaii TaxID=1010 RepID=UPI0028A20222|nr:helix-turn-helix domain-containing protein [Sphingobacterium mizutaii]